ncbi:MAG TPA: GNAT family protein [Bryobacteraceae bacterium]|nr:GNAT family protein [Bryobacteraceae bacterium]
MQSDAKRPGHIVLEGRYVILAPLDARLHGDALWEATRGEQNDALWQYLAEGPFRDRKDFDKTLEGMAASEDPLFFAIVDRALEWAIGRASYLRIDPKHRSIEVGSILYSPALQRTRGATEAMYLMARHAFEDLGYRRYEWKCNALNAPSRRAALRLGFTFEGIFRQHQIVKGRNRDTAWFSMLDGEWPRRKEAFERWLDPSNFSSDGEQKQRLADLIIA